MPEEIQLLLLNCRPRWWLLYAVAIFSGLRVKELRSLTVGHLKVDKGGLVLDAAWTKNRKDGFQPLPTDLLNRLAESAKDKGDSEPLLEVPLNAWEVLYRDLDRAGIKRKTAEGKVDFHSLRVTYINLIIENGASVKEAQDLARHSTPEMTMNVYARSRWDRRRDLAESIGQDIFRTKENKSVTTTGPQREMTDSPSTLKQREKRMRKGGLEPPQACAHKILNLARLPNSATFAICRAICLPSADKITFQA